MSALWQYAGTSRSSIASSPCGAERRIWSSGCSPPWRCSHGRGASLLVRCGARLFFGTRRFDELLVDFERLRTNHQVAPRNVRWHARDAGLARVLELLLDLVSICALGQDRAQRVAVQPVRLGEAGQHVRQGDVQPVDEVGAVYGASEGLAAALVVGPQRCLVRRL